jgi:predicted RNA-binding protein YlxR (DUF448 family)
MSERKCAGCGGLKNKTELIKITRRHDTGEALIARDTKTFGRSVYLCYNTECVEAAFKKNKLQKALRMPVSPELKGQLLSELRTD